MQKVKVWLKYIYHHHHHHLNNNNILVEEQFGFRKKSTTEKVIYNLTHEILKLLTIM